MEIVVISIVFILLGFCILYCMIKNAIIESGIVNELREVRKLLNEIKNKELGEQSVEEVLEEDPYISVIDKCPACGEKLLSTDKVCPSCGLNFEPK